MVFKWTSEIETGNHLIDSEHQELINIINHFLQCCKEGKAKEELLTTVRFLKNYTATHFAHEEQIQRESGYPDYARHKKIHDGFIQKVGEIEEKFQQDCNSMALVCQLNVEVGTWVMTHIRVEDIKLGKYLEESSKHKHVFGS